MQIEMRDLDQIHPYENNPRQNDQAVDAVAASIKEFGWHVPIVCDQALTIICGHTRYKAARKLGLKQVPVHVATDLSPEQVKAYRLADNQLATLAEWDKALLPIELSSLESMGYDLTLLGFDAEELAQWMSGEVQEGLTDPDDIPAPPDEPVTQAGDLWILGHHRLLCGDSGKPEDVDRLLDGAPIHLVNTDPPYNVRLEPRSNNAIAAGLSSFTNDALRQKKLLNKTCRMEQLDAKHSAIDASDTRGMHHQGFDLARDKTKAKGTTRQMRPKDRPLANDFVSDEAFDAMLDAWFGNMARVLLPGHGFYIWGGYANLGNYPPYLKKHGLYFSQGIVWDKLHPVLTRKDFLGAFEIAFYGWKEGAGHRFYGPNNVTDLWHVKKVPPQQMIHLTEKSVELAVRAMQYSSLAGENVLDLFGGSGSTLIAAEQTGRKAYLMEMDAPYCDVIADRYQRFTGQKARRVGADGAPKPGLPDSAAAGRKPEAAQCP